MMGGEIYSPLARYDVFWGGWTNPGRVLRVLRVLMVLKDHKSLVCHTEPKVSVSHLQHKEMHVA